MGYLLDVARPRQAERAARHRQERAAAERTTTSPTAAPARSWRTATYPASHPYSWDVIGSMEDLSAASEEDVKSFFRLYYAPNNAYLSIVGDFDPAQAKAWVDEVLRRHPARKADHPAEGRAGDAAGRRSGSSTRTACRCRGCTSQWPTVGETHDDRFALDVLAHDPRRGADGADHQGAGLRRAGGRLGPGRASPPTRTSVSSASIMTPRPGHTLTDARGGGRRHHRAAEEGRADRRGDSEGDRRRGAGLRQQPGVEPRQGVPAGRRRRLPRRRRILPDRIQEDAVGDRRRRQACRQQVPDAAAASC